MWRLISIDQNDSYNMDFNLNYTGSNLGSACLDLMNRLNIPPEHVNLEHVNCFCSSSITTGRINIGRLIKQVIFHEPATIIIWQNGDKTVVKCGNDEIYDPEKGLAMAIAKYAFGNKGNYYNTFKKYLSEEVDDEYSHST